MTDILLEGISKDINVHIDFQDELMDSDNTKSTSEINAMHEELRYKQLNENIIQDVKKVLDLRDVVRRGQKGLKPPFKC